MRGSRAWLISALLLAACAPRGPRVVAASGAPAGGEIATTTTLPPPPLADGIFPCSDCHGNLEPDFTRRKLETHEDIVLRHGDRERWCFDCHDPNDRDKVRLAGGTLLPFEEAYRLCGQCHGDKLRDWRDGVHGKRIGSWNGARQSLLCASCHDAHAPHFEALAPKPPPVRPALLRRRP